MNPFIEKVIGGIVRAVVVWIAAKFGASLSDNEILQLTAEIVPLLLVLYWSFRQKLHAERVTLTAQAMRSGASREQVEAEVDRGNAPPVLTPKDVAPI